MRAARVLETVGCDAFVASDPFTVAWLTGFAADETWGPNPFAVAPLAVIRADGSVVAIVSEDEAPALAASGCEVVAYEGFTMGPLDPLARRARRARRRSGCSGRVAVEDGALPAARRHGGARPTRMRCGCCAPSRTTTRSRASAPRSDLRRRPGGGARGAAHRRQRARGVGRGADRDAGGGRRAALAAVRLRRAASARPRSAGRPAPRVVRNGDLAIVDLVPRLAGYFGDSCSTIAIGEVPAECRSAHARCSEALERGLAALAPGVRAGDLDALVREGLDYPHHTGHGVGVAAHEEPRIVPGRRDGARARHDRRAGARASTPGRGACASSASRSSRRRAARSSARTTSRSDRRVRTTLRSRGARAAAAPPRAAGRLRPARCDPSCSGDVGRRSRVP